jgi:hypothetical protein
VRGGGGDREEEEGREKEKRPPWDEDDEDERKRPGEQEEEEEEVEEEEEGEGEEVLPWRVSPGAGPPFHASSRASLLREYGSTGRIDHISICVPHTRVVVERSKAQRRPRNAGGAVLES